MIIVDQLQRGDSRLRPLAIVVVVGMFLLVAGLWRIQVMASQHYTRSESAQSVRLVRVPAVRGKILDRHGVALAENRPSYDLNLYLEELRPSFVFEYTNQFLPAYRAAHGGARPRGKESQQLQENARLSAYSNTVLQVSAGIGTNLPVSGERFVRHYHQALALPLPVAENLSSAQMAAFYEQCLGTRGVDLEVQAVRHYPFGRVAAHLLGHLRRSDEAESDPDLLMFRYRLRDYEGVAGIEGAFDAVLRGRAGVKKLVVNSQGYRHEDAILQPTEPGQNVRLTIDLDLQRTAEKALARVAGPATRGSAIVMDVHTGDLLAMVSLPAFDPNLFLGGMSQEQYDILNDTRMTPQMNRAVSGAYAPGSIYKIVVALAAMEAGILQPAASFEYPGYTRIGGRTINDTAPAGSYDFKRAFKRSSNAYFIDHGIKTGRPRIVAMSRRLGFGEPTEVALGMEASGLLPDDAFLDRLRKRKDGWGEGHTANLSIGQGALTVSPLQVAVMVSAIANGGKVLKPRLILRTETSDGDVVQEMPTEVRWNAQVDPRHLRTVRAAMLADVEEDEGTGKDAAVPGMFVCGKTGTAEIKRGGKVVDKITWFASFAPYHSPRYAVIIVVESGSSGARTSAPIAREIYQRIQERETGRTTTGRPVAQREPDHGDRGDHGDGVTSARG